MFGDVLSRACDSVLRQHIYFYATWGAPKQHGHAIKHARVFAILVRTIYRVFKRRFA